LPSFDRTLALAALLSLGLATPLQAQDRSDDPPPEPAVAVEPDAPTVFDGDFLSIGIGAAYGPSYEGSDDFEVYPAPALIGRIGGINIQSRGPGLALDLIADDPDARIGFVLGPVGRLRFDRDGDTGDAVINRLPDRDIAGELGVTAGVQVSRLLSPYDTLSATVDVVWDVTGVHDGRIISPQLAYFTPVSRGAAVTLSVSADFVDDDFADYYFSVTPEGSAASGLPVFTADGGLKSVGGFALLAIDLDGDLANGGWGLFAGGGYKRLYNDFSDSPIVSIRGDADQVLGVLGVGYTF